MIPVPKVHSLVDLEIACIRGASKTFDRQSAHVMQELERATRVLERECECHTIA